MTSFWLPRQIDAMVARQLASTTPGDRAQPFVTISRAYGCDGHDLARLTAERLTQLDPGHPWRVANREAILEASDREQLSAKTLRALERYGGSQLESFFVDVLDEGNAAETIRHLAKVVRLIARGGHVVLLGAGACILCAGMPGGLHVRLDAPEPWRIANHSRRWGIDVHTGGERVRSRGRDREAWVSTFLGQNIGERAHYDLYFDNSVITAAEAAEEVVAAVRRRQTVRSRSRVSPHP